MFLHFSLWFGKRKDFKLYKLDELLLCDIIIYICINVILILLPEYVQKKKSRRKTP